MASADNCRRPTSCIGRSTGVPQKGRRLSYSGQIQGLEHNEQVNGTNVLNHVLQSIEVGTMPRRTSRPASDESFTCSQQSILSAMDRFVKSVTNMDATVLVPSRLRDMELQDSKHIQRPSLTSVSSDLYSFYSMLNDVKNELLWGPSASAPNPMIPVSGRSTPRELKHVRQASEDSLALGSTGSTSDTDSDVDSVVTDRESFDEQSSHIATAFRHHLQGLHTILHQLADAADYLSARYQEEVDASSL